MSSKSASSPVFTFGIRTFSRYKPIEHGLKFYCGVCQWFFFVCQTSAWSTMFSMLRLFELYSTIITSRPTLNSIKYVKSTHIKFSNFKWPIFFSTISHRPLLMAKRHQYFCQFFKINFDVTTLSIHDKVPVISRNTHCFRLLTHTYTHKHTQQNHKLYCWIMHANT